MSREYMQRSESPGRFHSLVSEGDSLTKVRFCVGRWVRHMRRASTVSAGSASLMSVWSKFLSAKIFSHHLPHAVMLFCKQIERSETGREGLKFSRNECVAERSTPQCRCGLSVVTYCIEFNVRIGMITREQFLRRKDRKAREYRNNRFRNGWRPAHICSGATWSNSRQTFALNASKTRLQHVRLHIA